jgi:predicted MPP superfamily phosphohydrolase
MNRIVFGLLIVAVLVGIDFYLFSAFRFLTQNLSARWRTTLHIAFWAVSAFGVALLLAAPLLATDSVPRVVRNQVFAVFGLLLLSKLVAAGFFLADDLRRALQWSGLKIYRTVADTGNADELTVSRSVFMSWLGVTAGGGLFGSLLWGVGNRYRYRTENVSIRFENLPEAFRGLRIVHISDIHAGSFTDRKAVEKGVERILAEKPDIILFTGDLVNDSAEEMRDYKELFSRLSAPMGVFSCLGNHDYGDYRPWPDADSKRANLQALKDTHRDMGWRLLMNEHVALERDGQTIALLGIENWGAKANFKKYGRLDEAWKGSEIHPFKILLSHDPSHWEAQVRRGYPDIDLMLSGHTHGMQFGVEIPGFRWSPVQYVYRQWAGLYREGRQALYVNRGFGFLGYPGRVGILPEITVIELA